MSSSRRCPDTYREMQKGKGMIGEGNWDMETGKKKASLKSKHMNKNMDMSGSAKKSRKVFGGNIDVLVKPSIKAMSLVAQADSLSGDIYGAVRHLARNYIDEMMKKTILITMNNKKKTVSIEDVEHVLGVMPSEFALSTYYKDVLENKNMRDFRRCTAEGMSENIKTGGKDKLAQVQERFANAHGECLYTSRAGFARLIREVAQDYTSDLKFSQDALLYIQLLTEQFLIEILSYANLIAKNAAARSKVTRGDLVVVMKVRGFNLTEVKKIERHPDISFRLRVP